MPGVYTKAGTLHVGYIGKWYCTKCNKPGYMEVRVGYFNDMLFTIKHVAKGKTIGRCFFTIYDFVRRTPV